jgi:PAS domain S-box-containing protein
LTIDKLIEDKLDFKFLPGYALFLKDNYLEELVVEQLRIAKAINVPLLRYLEGVPDTELVRMSMVSTAIFLDFLIENKAEEHITASIRQWTENQLPQISREQIVAEDITLVSFMRKKSLIKFLPFFTNDITEILGIIDEIDLFIAKSETANTNTYINLLKEGLAEETHFKNSIADTAPGIIFIYDLEKSRHIYINEKIEQLYGYAPGELRKMGDKVYDLLIHPDDLHAFKTRYENLLLLKDGEVRSVEYRLKMKDDSYRWLRNYEAVFKRGNDGKPRHMIGFAINIDVEKQTAEQLEHNREQLLEAQELAEMGSFVWDLVSNKTETSPQLRTICQLPDGSRMQDFVDRVHPADRQRFQKCLQDALAGEGNYDCEYRYIADGKEKILWSRGVVAFEDGKAVKMKGTMMDVTERHHMIQRLQRSEELYKQAQALSHMGNWTWDLRTNKFSWTDEMYRIFGLEPQSEDIDLEKFFSFIHPEDREQRITAFEQSLRDHQHHEYDFRILLPGDTLKMLHGQAEVLVDNHGQPYKMFGACQDVTEQKQVEKELLDNKNFIQKIADAAPSIISAYNIHTGKYLFLNQAFEKNTWI